MNTLKSQKQVRAMFKTALKHNDKARDYIHSILVQIIGHAVNHGDVTLATEFIHADIRGTDRQAIIDYLADLGCFTWVKTEAQFKCNKEKRKNMVFDMDYLNSEDCPRWYSYAKDVKKLNTAFDLETRVLSLLKSLSEVKQKGEREVRNDGLKSYIETAIARYHDDVSSSGEIIEGEIIPETLAIAE